MQADFKFNGWRRCQKPIIELYFRYKPAARKNMGKTCLDHGVLESFSELIMFVLKRRYVEFLSDFQHI